MSQGLLPTRDGEPLPPSAYVLLLANAVPLIGVVARHWTVFAVLLLYWSENVVVGAFNVLKILTAQPRDAAAWLGKLFLIPFFIFHFGMFTYVHGVFVFSLFGHDAFSYPSGIVAALRANRLMPAIGMLLLSHGFSFVHNYLMDGENVQASLPQLMALPYGRVVVLHLTVLFGGFAVMALGAPVIAMVVLVALKTGLDLRAHLAERDKFPSPVTISPSDTRMTSRPDAL